MTTWSSTSASCGYWEAVLTWKRLYSNAVVTLTLCAKKAGTARPYYLLSHACIAWTVAPAWAMLPCSTQTCLPTSLLYGLFIIPPLDIKTPSTLHQKFHEPPLGSERFQAHSTKMPPMVVNLNRVFFVANMTQYSSQGVAPVSPNSKISFKNRIAVTS